MKRLFIFLITVLILVTSCTSESLETIVIDNNPVNATVVEKPSTNVWVQGSLINNFYTTRAGKYGDAWPKSMAAEGWESAKFSIRIDGNIPGYVNQDAAKYWGGQEGPNLGKIDITYPFNHYDDRGLDYYLVDTKTGENTGLFRYILDPTGTEVEKALIEKPDVWEILEYWQNKSNVKEKELLDGVIANKQNLKVIWYVAKEVGGRYYWHVNGILTDKSTEDVFEEIKDEIEKDNIIYNPVDPIKVKDNVEVDIHLQQHKTWNEIKTSIHIRTDIESIKINIPIEYNDIVEKDDFAIRVFDYYFAEYNIKNVITHNNDGITINITNIDPTFIDMLKSKFGDGLTIEIHSYCTKLDGIWDKMKLSTIVTGKQCNLQYQITNAYNSDKIQYQSINP